MFKVGDKVRCINNDGVALDLNKIYIVEYINIIDGLGVFIDLVEVGGRWSTVRFVKDNREEKLRRILDAE